MQKHTYLLVSRARRFCVGVLMYAHAKTPGPRDYLFTIPFVRLYFPKDRFFFLARNLEYTQEGSRGVPHNQKSRARKRRVRSEVKEAARYPLYTTFAS